MSQLTTTTRATLLALFFGLLLGDAGDSIHG